MITTKENIIQYFQEGIKNKNDFKIGFNEIKLDDLPLQSRDIPIKSNVNDAKKPITKETKCSNLDSESGWTKLELGEDGDIIFD